MIVEAYLVDDERRTESVRLATIERELTTDSLGLTLAEGKALLADAQKYLVRSQCTGIAAAHSVRERCNARLSVKGNHARQIRTVFGRVTVQSSRVRHCKCAGKSVRTTFSPLTEVLPTCVTPELEYLQVKWAAQLPYAAATKLLGEILPITDALSVSGVKRRVRAVGAALEQSASTMCVASPEETQVAELNPLSALAVDSVWLTHCDRSPGQARHVNLVTGRACFLNGRTRLYAYDHNQVPSAAARLGQLLQTSGVQKDDRVTIVTDGAGEFDKITRDCAQPMCRVLDWFHIAMKFRSLEQMTTFKYSHLLAPNGRTVRDGVTSAKWRVWHGKASKAVARLKRIHDRFRISEEDQYRTLYWNLRQTFWYLRANEQYLVNYSRRYHKALTIGSAIAESAVNQVVSLRMANTRQIRWSDAGARLLAQVRVHEINGELQPRALPMPLRLPKPPSEPEWDAYLLAQAA
jgi:hypothetical protein